MSSPGSGEYEHWQQAMLRVWLTRNAMLQTLLWVWAVLAVQFVAALTALVFGVASWAGPVLVCIGGNVFVLLVVLVVGSLARDRAEARERTELAVLRARTDRGPGVS